MRLSELTSGFCRSFQRHSITVFLSLIVLSGLYGLFGVGAMAAFNVHDLMTRLGNQIELTVYLDETGSENAAGSVRENGGGTINVNSDERDNKNAGKVAALVLKIPSVQDVQTVTSQQAKKLFSDKLLTYAPELVNDPEFANIFPASLVLKVDSSLTTSEIKSVVAQIQALDGVSEVSYGQDWVNNFKHFSQATQKFGILFLGIFVLAGFFIIGNLQRLSISERVEEIEILELIGATSRRIRAPFLFEGATLGLLASFLGIGFCSALFYAQAKIFSQDLPFLDVLGQFRFFTITECVLFCISGTFLGFIGSLFATRRICDSWVTASRRSET